MTTYNPSLTFDIQNSISQSTSLGEGAHTGKVGTALYVSPEMIDANAKAHYSQVKLYMPTKWNNQVINTRIQFINLLIILFQSISLKINPVLGFAECLFFYTNINSWICLVKSCSILLQTFFSKQFL